MIWIFKWIITLLESSNTITCLSKIKKHPGKKKSFIKTGTKVMFEHCIAFYFSLVLWQKDLILVIKKTSKTRNSLEEEREEDQFFSQRSTIKIF